MGRAILDRVKPQAEPTDEHALVEGRWIKRMGGVAVFVPADKASAINPANECPDCGGFLLPGTRCDICLTWAVKNSRDFEWARMSWANRGQIWDVLAVRKEREEAA